MKRIILLFLLLGLNTYAQPVWEKLNGPMGCVTAGLVAKGDTLIVGTGYFKGLIFFSTNGGNYWQESNIKSITRFADFVFNGDAVFAALYDNSLASNINGIYKSYDLVNWTSVYNSNLHFWSLGKDAFGGIYAGTDEGVVLYSPNNGNNWTTSIDVDGRNNNFTLSEDSTIYVGGGQKILRKNPFSSWDILTLNPPYDDYYTFMDDNKNLYAHCSSLIFKSTNKGNNWIQLDTNGFFQTVNNTVYSMIFNHRMMAGLEDETFFIGTGWGLAVSNDSGLTWNWSNNGLPPKFDGIVKLAKSGINTYAGTNAAGIFESTDFGDSWFPVNNGIYAATTVDITFDKDSNLYTANWSNGIQKSTDRGTTWEVINNGLTNSYLYSIIADTNNNLMAGTDQGIFRSTDHGENWVQTNNAGNNYAYFLFKDRANRIYALTYGTGLYRTTDLGYSWTSLNNGFSSLYLFGFAIDSSDNIYVGAWNGWIYKSTNDGAGWLSVYHSSVYNSSISSISVSSNGSIFAANITEGVLRSTNHGQNWSLVKPDVGNQFTYPININKEGEIFTTGTGDKFFRSTDNGQSWEDITGNLQLVSIKRILFDKNDKIYLATDESAWRGDRIIPVELVSFCANANNNGVVLNWTTANEMNNKGFEVQRSEVKGQRSEASDWQKIGFVEGNGTTTEQKEYSFIDKNVSAGTYSYRLKQIDFDGSFKFSREVEVELNPKQEFSLEQNYPNPFNPTTTIKYSVPKNGFVSLKVFNVLGQQIGELINTIVKAGSHEVTFNAEKLSSGVYYYRIEGGGNIAVKKMMVVK